MGMALTTVLVPDQLPFPEKEFDFEERPSQDFFCPVSLELLLEPQQTSCCGNHLSLEVATRLRREAGKACPVCNGEQWSAMPDKYHRRKVHEIRVRCWNKDSGCGWVGEVNELKRHAVSCDKRPWECEYCGLKCTVGEGEGKHWPHCHKFPEPCPNGCEVGSVERCGMEQHLSVCPLEHVACEMKEFGCSVVVPRRELATHMRESELQHLTAMTALNLRLTRQLQQESAERDRKMERLQLEVKELNTNEVKSSFQVKELTQEVAKMSCCLNKVQQVSLHVEQHTAAMCSGKIIFTVDDYRKSKSRANDELSCVYWCSDKCYTRHNDYAFRLVIIFYEQTYSDIGAFLQFLEVDELQTVTFEVTLELLNQAGDHHHLTRQMTLYLNVKKEIDHEHEIDENLIGYTDLEKTGEVQYMMNDCLKFRINVTKSNFLTEVF
ncbi:TNF receptor-associated factor 6 [Geodia barretti]|uniref:TNF receptor-associated factor 6 n=1 Tax=Geodia barretti TaxID=519541 RepID=A0AA35R488_GEOBA|nr:TNF receptor-associated factor 6 [Geodia barretti]